MEKIVVFFCRILRSDEVFIQSFMMSKNSIKLFVKNLSLHISLFLNFKKISVSDNETGMPNVVLLQIYLD